MISLIALITLVFLLYLLLRAQDISYERTGKVMLFFGLFVLPILTVGGGLDASIQQSSSTKFCLSCHEMDPWGQSLLIADEDAIPAVHFQNNYVPQKRACYTCHTNYAMFGGFRAKLSGLRHLYAHYITGIPEEIEFRGTYTNANCLHCHGTSRDFRMMDDHDVELLYSGEESCLECHDVIHPVEELEDFNYHYPDYVTGIFGYSALPGELLADEDEDENEGEPVEDEMKEPR